MTHEVPEGWEQVKQGDVATFYNGRAYKKTEWEKTGTPVIRLQNLTGSGQKYYYSNLQLPAHQYCDNGDLLYMWSATFGPHVWQNDKAIYHYHIWKVICDAKRLDKSFHYHLLDQKTKEWLSGANGMAMLHITKGNMEKVELVIPPLSEQKKIAEVLSSVDEAIAATKAVIDQTKQVKKGLLQTLFHRGTWDKRPMPEGYSEHLLDKVAKRGSGHTPDKKKDEYWNGGIKWVSLQDTKKLDKLYICNTTAEISEEGINNSSAVLHPTNIVVLSRDATVGKSAITTEPMAVSQHFIAWHCGEKLNRYYLYYWLQHMKPVFEMIGAGSTIKTIGLPFFKKLKIPMPSVEKQKHIGQRMKDVDEVIFNHEYELAQLQTLKSGLMSDLLTGRKRVEV